MIKIVSLLVVLFVSVFANAQTDSTGVSQRFNSEQFLFTLKNDVLTDTLICQELITQFSEQISSVKTSEKSTELLVSVCEFYIHLKDYSDANIYYQHAQETAVKFSTPDLNVRLLLIKSDLLAVSRNYGDAIVSYFDALELAEEFKLVDLQAAISLR
ncbi:MAG: hypothetical protein RIS47_1495, partial [Bacteroidota bacterium]